MVDSNDFEWLKILRFYCLNDREVSNEKRLLEEKSKFNIKVLNQKINKEIKLKNYQVLLLEFKKYLKILLTKNKKRIKLI